MGIIAANQGDRLLSSIRRIETDLGRDSGRNGL